MKNLEKFFLMKLPCCPAAVASINYLYFLFLVCSKKIMIIGFRVSLKKRDNLVFCYRLQFYAHMRVLIFFLCVAGRQWNAR